MPDSLTAEALMDRFADARARTLELVEGLAGMRLVQSDRADEPPMLWSLGHIAWYQERWILRELDEREPMIPDVDGLFGPGAAPGADPSGAALPPLEDVLAYMTEVHNALLDRLAGQVGSGLTPEERYFYQRVLFAEDMQGEAFLRLRQLRGDPRPDLVDTNAGLDPDDEPRAGALAGDVTVPGGTFRLGAEGEAPFVFDNEKWAHEVALAPFAIARAPVTNAEFAAFVADGGYAEPRFWDEAGWQWRESLGIRHPLAWVDDGGGHWFLRDFDGRRPLPMQAPVSQVSLHEAEAFCRWAGRRLPTEAEWEAAAAAEPEGAGLASAKRMYPWGEGRPTMDRANLDARYLGPLDVADCPGGESALGARQMLGNVWEWTASAFAPYPGFTPDPDPDYSQRGFGGARVLRGGSWATRGRVVRSTLRGFAHPWRNDLFAGFRTCALDPEGE